MVRSGFQAGTCPSPKIVRHMTVVKLREMERAIAKVDRADGDGTSDLLGWGAEAQYYRDVIAVMDAYAAAHKPFKRLAKFVKVRRSLRGKDVGTQIQAVHRQLLTWFEELVHG